MDEIAEDPSPWSGLPPETVIGHVHLHVADLEKAEAFYHRILGFDLIARLGTAAGFVSAGGYHHHIGYNTWLGEGAPPPPPDAAGLRYFVIRLPSREELEKVVERVQEAGIRLEKRNNGLFLRDPSQNGIVLRVDSSENGD
jgi:catechol 2,3-dioxygenase